MLLVCGNMKNLQKLKMLQQLNLEDMRLRLGTFPHSHPNTMTVRSCSFVNFA